MITKIFLDAAINPKYLQIAADFLSECFRLAVPTPVVTPMMDGFRFSFRDDDGEEIGDGVIHRGSYHHDSCIETIGMPWDEDDVSTHTPQELAILLHEFYYGEEDYDEGDCDYERGYDAYSGCFTDDV